MGEGAFYGRKPPKAPRPGVRPQAEPLEEGKIKKGGINREYQIRNRPEAPKPQRRSDEAIGDELGSAADSLNEAIKEAETAIRKLGFTRGARILLLEADNAFLYFDKPEDKWRLTLLIGGKRIGLLSSALGLRVAAAKAIPFLVNELMDARSVQAMDVVDAARRLSEFTDSLPGGENG